MARFGALRRGGRLARWISGSGDANPVPCLGMTQDFAPVRAICAHLNAFHVYADEPGRSVEANHYCTHLSAEVSLGVFLVGFCVGGG